MNANLACCSIKSTINETINPSEKKTLFIFTHDDQIKWYSVFAKGFREFGNGYRSVVFVHGESNAQQAQELECYDEVIDLLEGFVFDTTLTNEDLTLSQEILALEKESASLYFWEDLNVDRWARAKGSAAYLIQYMNHVTSVVIREFDRCQPVAALGEYTMALYRFVHRFFENHSRPMLYPITTRYFGRLYFETSLSWEWKRCVDLYQQFLTDGIPDDLLKEVTPYYEKIAIKYDRPNYTNYQNNFSTGYVQLRRLGALTFFRKTMRALFPGVSKQEGIRNLRYAPLEDGFLKKVSRIVRDRNNHVLYNRCIRKTLPSGLKYGIYFLHYQPEYTTDALGRFYSAQQYLIGNIAASLPADMWLVVKEHPTMVGLRDAKLYRQIVSSPNVILVDHKLDSIDLIKNASIVFTIVGTPALEAMFIGKPAIMFGKYAFADTNLITMCPDFWSLSAMVREKLQDQPVKSVVKQHALALLAAKYAASYPGQIPIAIELIEPFLKDEENYALVKKAFQLEIGRICHAD